jgi:outer membrane immunogenic protein
MVIGAPLSPSRFRTVSDVSASEFRMPVMKRSTILAIVAATALTGAVSAQAADIPARPAPVYKAAPFVMFDWTGFHAGVNGGYNWGRTSWSDPAVGADSGSYNINGAFLGGQIGYDWQTGPFVLGIESDLDWAHINGSSGAGGVCATDGGGQCQTKQSWFGTTRGRIGYSFDRWLPFVTGGVAYGDIRAEQPSGTGSSTKAGWTAGAGVEYGINRNWSAKVEYLHIDLGTATFMGAASGTSTLAVPVTDDLVRMGLNYHW